MSQDTIQEALTLLKILALGNQDVAESKIKPAADIIARLRAKRTGTIVGVGRSTEERMSWDGQKPMVRLNIRQQEALEILAPDGTKAAKEDMAGAMSAFPWRINDTGRAIRTKTLRQLERRGLVALADGEYRITDAGLQLIKGSLPGSVRRQGK
jgi:uncharacterized protein YjhX (UPF0386 family)